MLPANGLDTDLHLPDLSPFWRACSPLAPPHTLTPLAFQLGLCALQRIGTLHEQLLHKQYTCPFIVADLPNQAAATAAAEGPESSQAASIAPHAADAIGTDRPGGVHDHVSADAKVLQVKLTQLSDQVLQHAILSLKLNTDRSAALPTSKPERISQQQSKTRLRDEFWPVMSPLMPILAAHASQSSLQSFTEQLIACVIPAALLTPGQTQALPGQAASASASSVDSSAAVSSRLLQHPTFLEQPQLRRAWLLALQKRLSALSLPSASLSQAGSATQHGASAQGRQSSKKRPRTSSLQSGSELALSDSTVEESRHTGTEMATPFSLCEQLTQTLQLVTQFLADSKSAAATQASLKQNKHSSSSKSNSASKKRKQAEPSMSLATQASSSLLSHVTEILQHIALMPLALLSPDNTSLLAQLLLQAQLWLAQATTAAAAAEAMADDAVRMNTQAMLSIQQSLASCLKHSPNAAAALMVHAGPQLWQWLPTAAELVRHIQTLNLGSSTRNLSVAQSAQPQTGNITPVLPMAQGQSLSQADKAIQAGPLSRDAMSMLEETSACMRCLACFCFDVRQEAGTTTAAAVATADNGAHAVENLGSFLSWLAAEIKV